MSKCSEWIEDMLGTAKESGNIEPLTCCGRRCAERKNFRDGMAQLRVAACNCKTRADYAEFLNNAMPVHIEETEDGILMHLGKTECSCPMAKELTKHTDMLCECTRGHEIAVWSEFFGKHVDIEIVESHLRGGKDCVIKIIL